MLARYAVLYADYVTYIFSVRICISALRKAVSDTKKRDIMRTHESLSVTTFESWDIREYNVNCMGAPNDSRNFSCPVFSH
jgi:hypothetical protein